MAMAGQCMRKKESNKSREWFRVQIHSYKQLSLERTQSKKPVFPSKDLKTSHWLHLVRVPSIPIPPQWTPSLQHINLWGTRHMQIKAPALLTLRLSGFPP
jgi:hypothetical protein